MTEPAVQHIIRENRTAQVAHVCTACKTPIHPGQRYTRAFFLQDGKPHILKYHEARQAGEDECNWTKGGKQEKDDVSTGQAEDGL